MPALSAPAKSLRLVLVDDTATFRALVRERLLAAFPHLELHDYAEARPALEACLAQPPDILVADLYLGRADGRDLVRQLRERGLKTHVVILTAFPEAGLPAELLSLGVAGFVDKNSPLEQIERAVQCVLEGGLFFSATVPPPVPTLTGEPALPRLGADALTEREREVVRLVARGLLSKQVADTLGLSPRTVEKYRGRIMAKLGLHDIPMLVRWCLRNGLG